MRSSVDRRTFCLSGCCLLGSAVWGGEAVGKELQIIGCQFASSVRNAALTIHDLEEMMISQSSGHALTDQNLSDHITSLNEYFSVSPGCFFFDEQGSPNALASSIPLDSRFPDGTVLIGRKLVQRLLEHQSAKVFHLSIASVLAHEWAHIEQYKSGQQFDWSARQELDADQLSGRYIGHIGGYTSSRLSVTGTGRLVDDPNTPADITSVSQLFFGLGDTEYGNTNHHGTSLERQNAFLLGFLMGD